MKIYLDLDGPILNPKQRYWEAHTYAVKKLGGNPFKNANYYWKQKQNFIPKEIILTECEVSTNHIEKYINIYASVIESKKFLLHDLIQQDAENVLKLLSESHELLLVSARSNLPNTLWQLEQFKISKYFKKFLITATKPGRNQDEEKTALIRQESLTSKKLGKVIIGDTNAEIQSAKQLGIISIAVLNGLRSKNFLQQFHPDYIVNSIKEIPLLLDQIFFTTDPV